MDRFPGYKSEREVKARREHERLAQTERAAQARMDDCRRSFVLIRDALPLLIEHGHDLAIPAEVPRLMFWHVVRPAWVVKSYMSSGGGPMDRVTQGPVEQLWAITEDGRYGQVQRVDRGMSALRFFAPPRRLSPDLFSGQEVERTGKRESEVIAERIDQLLRKAGLSSSKTT